MPEQFDPNELEKRLQGDVETAQKRAQESSRAIGVKQRVDDKRGVVPRSIRIKGKILGEAELAEIDTSLNKVVTEITRNQRFTDMSEQATFENQRRADMNKFREELMRKGALVEQQLNDQKLSVQEAIAVQNSLAGLAEAAGFAFALSGRNKGKGPETLGEVQSNLSTQQRATMEGVTGTGVEGSFTGFEDTTRRT